MPIPPPTEKQAKIIWSSLTIFAVAIALTVIGFVFYGLAVFLSTLSPILMPIAIAGILACILDPLVCFFEQFKVPRFRAILLVYVIVVTMTLGLLGTVVPAVYVQASDLINELPEYGEKFYDKFLKSPEGEPVDDEILIGPEGVASTNPAAAPVTGRAAMAVNVPTLSPASTNAGAPVPITSPRRGTSKEGLATWFSADGLREKVRQVWKGVDVKKLEQKGKEILPAVGNWVFQKFIAATHLLGWAVGIVLIPVYMYYFLNEKSGIQRNWKTYLPIHHDSDFREDFIFIVNSINDALIVFFRGQILVGIISGTLLAIALSIQGVKYALLIGVLAALLGVVPYLGFIISITIAILVSAIQFGNLTQPAITLGICMVIHLAEGFGYQPKIIGDRVGLHPMAIIVGLFLGATLLGGLLGGLLAIPLTALLRTLMYRYVWVKKQEDLEKSGENIGDTSPTVAM